MIQKESTLATYSLRKIQASTDLEAIDALSEERDASISQKKQAYEEGISPIYINQMDSTVGLTLWGS